MDAVNRGVDRVANKAKAAIFIAIGFALVAASTEQVAASDNFDFAGHHVDSIYRGKLNLPDFKGRDKGFASFKTRITDAMKAGVTFAGQYSVVQFGCGTGCTGVVIANNRTGQLYDFPRGGEYNQGLELQFARDSNLMLARWFTDSTWETCIFEAFVFDDGKWAAREAFAGKGEDVCSGEVAAGAAKARGL